MELKLVPSKWSDFKEDLLTHYAGSRGVIGRSFFYAIMLDGEKIGVIGAQGVSLPMLPVAKELYGADKITSLIRKRYFTEVMNNDIFRLYKNEKNLASRILSIFVKVLYKDHLAKHGTKLYGLISLTYGTNEKGVERTGLCYKASNWKYLGMSKGARKHLHGMGEKREDGSVDYSKPHATYEKVESKHVWLWTYHKEIAPTVPKKYKMVFKNGKARMVEDKSP